jgi:hypothetical protein
MAQQPLKKIALPDTDDRIITGWLEELDGRLSAPGADWNRIARDTLVALYHPDITDFDERVQDPAVPAAARAALRALDPRGVTLEPEYYADVDPAKFARVKPLLWLWYSFDRSPAGGQNVDLGVRFRRVLAPHLLARCGRNFKCFQHVEFSLATTWK